MSEDNKQRLLEALGKLGKYEDTINEEIKILEELKTKYQDSNKEVLDEKSEDYENDEIIGIRATIKHRETTIGNINDLLRIFTNQLTQIGLVRNFSLGIRDITEFVKMASVVYSGANVITDTYMQLQKLSKV